MMSTPASASGFTRPLVQPVFRGSAGERLMLQITAIALICLGLVVALTYPQRSRTQLDASHRSMEKLLQYESRSLGAGKTNGVGSLTQLYVVSEQRSS